MSTNSERRAARGGAVAPLGVLALALALTVPVLLSAPAAAQPTGLGGRLYKAAGPLTLDFAVYNNYTFSEKLHLRCRRVNGGMITGVILSSPGTNKTGFISQLSREEELGFELWNQAAVQLWSASSGWADFYRRAAASTADKVYFTGAGFGAGNRKNPDSLPHAVVISTSTNLPSTAITPHTYRMSWSAVDEGSTYTDAVFEITVKSGEMWTGKTPPVFTSFPTAPASATLSASNTTMGALVAQLGIAGTTSSGAKLNPVCTGPPGGLKAGMYEIVCTLYNSRTAARTKSLKVTVTIA